MNPEQVDLFVALVQATATHKGLAVPAAEDVKTVIDSLASGVKTVLAPHIDATEIIMIIEAVCAVMGVVCPLVPKV